MDIQVKKEVLDVHKIYSDQFFDCDIVKEETTIQEVNVLVQRIKTRATAPKEELMNFEITEIESKVKAKKEHKCEVCGKQLKNAFGLKKHMQVHNKKTKEPKEESTKTFIECEKCGEKLSRKTKLKSHMERMHESIQQPDNFPCKFCNEKFMRKELLERHQETHLTTDNDVLAKCIYCSKFFRRKALRNHMKVYHRGLPKIKGATPKCTICKKTLKNLKNLKRHVDQIHPKKSNIFECAICGVKSKRVTLIKMHIMRVHLKIPDIRNRKDAKCPLCAKSIAKRHLPRHIRSHSAEKPYSCEICGKSYKTKDEIRLHSFTHVVFEKDQGMKCFYCERIFYVRNFLCRHIRNNHRGLPVNGKDPPFKCTVCKKSYVEIDKLKKHVSKIHKDDFKCSICGMTYKMKSNFIQHIRNIHQEKVY